MNFATPHPSEAAPNLRLRTRSGLGLGIDAGGEQARSALARASELLPQGLEAGLAMLRRFGQRPIVVAGRVLVMSPLIGDGLRQQLHSALGSAADIQLQQLQPQRQAALAAASAAQCPPPKP